MITLNQLLKINKGRNQKQCEYYLGSLNAVLPRHGVDTPLRIAHFLAQVIHESGYLLFKEENLNYASSGLRNIWPQRFPTDEIANAYARQPERIANRAYANRMGNGDEASGDGWKYRGRGLIQLTGAENYRACGQALKLDLANNPDIILQSPDISVAVACWYWTSRNLNEWADRDDIREITRRVNGGFNGLNDRMSVLAVAKSLSL